MKEGAVNMKINFKKVIAILIILIMLITLLSTPVSAKIITAMSGYEKTGNTGALTTMGGKILGLIQTIGVAVAVIMLIVIAIRFITASPSGKADMKKQLILYTIGAIILFSASGLLGIIANFAEENI